MIRLAEEFLLGPLDKVNLPTSDSCMSGKAQSLGKALRDAHPLDLIHFDVCGPLNIKARHGASYFLIVVDDYTQYAISICISLF